MSPTRPLRRKALQAVALAAAVALVALAGIAFRSRRRLDRVTSPAVSRGPIGECVYGIGTVTATKSYRLLPGVTATVLSLYVKEGDRVKRGQKLAEIDEGVFFTAPFAGTITSLPCRIGENVFPQTVILELVDLTDRYLVVTLEQRAAIRVRPGQEARLSFENMRSLSYAGRVQSVYSHEDDFHVRIDAPGLPAEILPGMTADVAIAVAPTRTALLIPVSAITDGRVVVLRSGRPARSIPIQTGIVDGAMAELVAGDVREGDRLIVEKGRAP